jgi:hypothetical protein
MYGREQLKQREKERGGKNAAPGTAGSNDNERKVPYKTRPSK